MTFFSSSSFCDLEELLERDPSRRGAPLPRLLDDLVGLQAPPSGRDSTRHSRVEFDGRRRHHDGRLVGLRPGLDVLAAHVADAEGEDPLGGHEDELVRPDQALQHRGVLLQRLPFGAP